MENKFHLLQPDLTNLLMQLPLATYIVQMPSYTIAFMNEKALDCLGRSWNDTMHQPVQKIFTDKDIEKVLDDVCNTGQAYTMHEVAVERTDNGKTGTVYLDITHQPMLDADKKISSIMCTCTNVTKQISIQSRFNDIVAQVPVGICILKGPNFIVEMANPTYLQIVDRSQQTFIGNSLFDSLPEVRTAVEPLLINVLQTGNPFYGNEFMVHLNRYGNRESTYFNFVYQPLIEADGSTSGVIVVANEVTGIVESKQTITESERQFRELIMQSPIAMTIFRGPDFIIENPNNTLLNNIWKKELHEVEHKKVLDVFPELKDQQFPKLLETVFKTGVAYSEKESVAFVEGNEGMKKYYLDFQYSPLFERDGSVSGIMVTVNDVTDKVETRLKIKESEQRLLLANEAAEMGTFDWDLSNKIFVQSERVSQIFGFDGTKNISHTDLLDVFHPDDKPIRDKAVAASLHNGSLVYEARIVWPDKSIHWVKVFGKIIYNTANEPQRMYGTVTDITASKNSMLALEESENKLNIAIDATELGTFDINMQEEEMNHSAKYLEIYGFDANDKPNRKDVINRIHPDDLAERAKAMEDAIKTGILDHETRVIYPDNTIHWVRVKGKLIHDKNNQPERILGTVRDITKDKEANQRLRENEERLNIAIQAAELGTWELNLRDRASSVLSAKYLEILGFAADATPTHEELLKKIHPDDMLLRNEQMEHAIEVSGALDFEMRLCVTPTNMKWIKVRGKVLYDSNGIAEKVLGTILDITERKMVEQELERKVIERTIELKRSEEINFRMINEVEDYAIILLNKEGIISNWNKGAEKIKGYTSNEIVGNHFSIFYTQQDRDNNLPSRIIGQAAASGRSVQEAWRVKKDGSLFWASIVITALHDDNNNLIGFSKVTRDLTERKMAEQQLEEKSMALEKANAALEESNNELEQFAYIASHDLQEPLRKIQFFVERIQKTAPEVDAAATIYFDKIKNSTVRMNTLIKDLLDFSRLSQNNERYVQVNLNEVIANITTDLELLIQQKKADIIVPQLPSIQAIPLQMQQLFYNIISNGLKFSKEENNVTIEIRCSLLSPATIASSYPNLDRHLRYYLISIKDNGIGFEQQYAEKIFVIFQRLNDLYTYGGTGIGLALCKKIVLNHKGEIFAESKETEGATFYIVLPETQPAQ